MTAREVKHQVMLAQWKERVMALYTAPYIPQSNDLFEAKTAEYVRNIPPFGEFFVLMTGAYLP